MMAYVISLFKLKHPNPSQIIMKVKNTNHTNIYNTKKKKKHHIQKKFTDNISVDVVIRRGKNFLVREIECISNST